MSPSCLWQHLIQPYPHGTNEAMSNRVCFIQVQRKRAAGRAAAPTLARAIDPPIPFSTIIGDDGAMERGDASRY